MAVQNLGMSMQNYVCTAMCPDALKFLFRTLDVQDVPFTVEGKQEKGMERLYRSD